MHSIVWMDDLHELKTKQERIEYVIRHAGHTPSSIAPLVGCKPSAIYQWLSGTTSNIKENLLWALEDVTGFSARWISTGEGLPRLDRATRHVAEVMAAMEPQARYMTARLVDSIAQPPNTNNQ